MQALILAAGMGRRLGNYTKENTKCMIEIAGRRLIDRTIDSIRQAGIKRLVVVIGFCGEKLKSYLLNSVHDMEFVFIENAVYRETNNIYSLYLARHEFEKDDTVLIESDLIYDNNLLSNLVHSPEENMVVVAKYEQWMDGTVVTVGRTGKILDFVEKEDFDYCDVDSYFKTVNIYKFSRQFIVQQYVPFLESYIKAYGKKQYYEMVLKILAHVRNSNLQAFVLDKYDWYEIDDEQDLRIASVIFADDDKQFSAYDHQFGGFWRFPKLNDFCYLVNPYYPPQKMLDQMKYFYDTLLRNYPSGLETQNLNAARMLGIRSEYTIVGNGAAELIRELGMLCSGKMLVTVPLFNEYVRCFKNCEFVKLESNTYDFSVPPEKIIEMAGNVDWVAIVNPDNPSGSFISYENILKIIDACVLSGTKIIIDESFIDFADDKVKYSLLDDWILEKYPNLFVIKSISKSYGVPGLRLGIMASSNKVLLQSVKQNMAIWNINSFAEYFLQIYRFYEEVYKSACNQIAYQRERMMNDLKQNNLLKVYPSQANFIMCQLKGNMTAANLANILVKKYNILIKDLSMKDGIYGKKFIRLAVKSADENVLLVSAIKNELY